MVVTAPCDVRIPNGIVAYPAGEFYVPEEHARQIEKQGRGHPHPTKASRKDLTDEREPGPAPHDRAASAG